jgi:raffinose/stachyose/melibiose transport system substrate-binding protein
MTTKKLLTGHGAARLLALGVACAMAGMLAGCSGSSGGSAPAGGSQIATNPTGTLNLLVSSSPGSNAGFEAVDRAFEAKYPKVKVVLSAIPNANYPAAETSRLTAGIADVVVAAPTQVPSYVPKSNEANDARLAAAGGFVNLTKMPFMKNFNQSVLKGIAFNGKDYTVPTGLSYYTGAYYNKAIFAKYNLSIPTTWSQFLALCNTLKSHGVSPIGSSSGLGGQTGLEMLAAVQGLYPTTADKQSLAESLWKQKTSLTDAKPLEVMTKTKQMYDLSQENFAGVPFSSIPSDFVTGKFAMVVDGTWDTTTYQQASAGKNFSFGYFPVPTSETAANNASLAGKVELRLAAASNAKNKGAALAYLSFFSQPANYKKFVAQAGFAPSEKGIALSPFLTSIAKYTSTFEPAWDTIWTANTKAGAAAVFPFNYAAIAPMGTDTAQQAAAAAQKDWAAGS